MTEISLQYTDKLQPWYQSVDTLAGYIWATLDGIVVAGSQENPTIAIPPQTGDTLADVAQYAADALTELTGDAPNVYSYPDNLPLLGYGIGVDDFGNTFHNRPFISIASNSDYTYGTLNIPPRAEVENQNVLVWRMRIVGNFSNSDQVSPAYKLLQAYRDAHGGKNPNLLVMELNAQ